MSTLVLDQFTDTDGTLLTAHAIAPTNTPATAWTAVVGGAQVVSNRAVNGGATNTDLATLDSGQADVTVTVTIRIPTGNVGRSGVVVRTSDVNNNWRVATVSGGAANGFRLDEINAAVTTTRAQGTPTVNADTDYTLTATTSGTTITGNLNTVDLSYASATLNQTVTKHGIRPVRGGGQASAQFDDFTVSAGGAAFPGDEDEGLRYTPIVGWW